MIILLKADCAKYKALEGLKKQPCVSLPTMQGQVDCSFNKLKSFTADHYWWCWIAVGVLIIGTVIFNIILVWAHQRLGGETCFEFESTSVIQIRTICKYLTRANHCRKN